MQQRKVIGMAKYNVPNETGHYGDYGGRFVPETLMPARIRKRI